MARHEIYQPIAPSLLREILETVGIEKSLEVSVVALGSGEVSKLTFI